MPKYLVTASYTSEGIRGVMKTGGTARSAAVKKAVEGLGGKLESFHFAFGKDDAFVILDMPDDIAAAALVMAITATGLTANAGHGAAHAERDRRSRQARRRLHATGEVTGTERRSHAEASVRDDGGPMNRRKFLLVLLTAAALVALGVWSYSSAPSSSTPRAAAAGSPPSAKTSGTTAERTKKTATSTALPTPTPAVAPNPQAYSKALFGYWQQHDRYYAASVANAAVVTELFARAFHLSDGWVVQACHAAAASTICTWTSPRRQFVFQIRGATGVPIEVVAMQILR